MRVPDVGIAGSDEAASSQISRVTTNGKEDPERRIAIIPAGEPDYTVTQLAKLSNEGTVCGPGNVLGTAWGARARD